MGYNAEKDDFDYKLLKQNVAAGHPVIMKRCRQFIFSALLGLRWIS